jgi:glycosyltransferase involved in cell wall biosynthesis
MRIAYVTGTFPPYFGGVGNVCYFSAIDLMKLGNDVTILTSNGYKEKFEYPNGLKVQKLKTPFQIGKSPFIPGLFRISAKNFDVVHLHHPFYFGSEITYLNSRLRNYRYVITYHMDIPFNSPNKMLRPLLKVYDTSVNRRIVKRANKIIVTSMDYALHSRMKGIFNERKDDVIEIPIGVDLDRFYPTSKNKRVLQEYSIRDDEKIVMFVGALDTQHYFKGVDILLEAFSKMDKDETKLFIVGEGNLKPSYINLAKQLKVDKKTVFTGRIENLAAFYSIADVVVLPSIDTSEAFGLVLVEAMASGKAVVASNLPGVRTVVDDDYNGFLVEPRNADKLSSRIQVLLNDDGLRKRFGLRGRKKAVEKYSWYKIALQLNEVYLKVIDEKVR